MQVNNIMLTEHFYKLDLKGPIQSFFKAEMNKLTLLLTWDMSLIELMSTVKPEPSLLNNHKVIKTSSCIRYFYILSLYPPKGGFAKNCSPIHRN